MPAGGKNKISTHPSTSGTETPWHLTDGHGNSIEHTGGHVSSTTRHRLEKLGAGYSEFHQRPSVVHRWKTSGHRRTLTIFEVITWQVAHSNAEKMVRNEFNDNMVHARECIGFQRRYYQLYCVNEGK